MGLYRTVFDNFVHIRKNGYFLDAAREFIKYGGTSMNIVNFPDYFYTPDSYYEMLYKDTIEVAKAVSAAGINTLTTIGPYPLDYFYFRSAGKDPVFYMEKGIDMAISIIDSGNADAMGEIGYPHFPVAHDVYSDSEIILEYALEACHDHNIPLILHTEDMNEEGYLRLESLIKRHYKVNRVLKHHANPCDLKFQDNILKSVIASRKNTRAAINSGKDFLLETDYTDQKEKPGKVIPVYSVPKRAEMIKNMYKDHDEIFHKIFELIPFNFYGKEFFDK
ncbi:TatD family hydrolase [Ferroplasma sp.]|uniref:TatD family hydrolase n=1 Tax=Ferroplasma sp. TaxID=2591003 RepID=UPI00307E1316